MRHVEVDREADACHTLAVELLAGLKPETRRAAGIVVEADETLPTCVAEPLVWRLVARLGEHVRVLADATDAEALRWHRPDAGRTAPTHLLRLGGRADGPGAWVAWWRLVELEGGAVVGSVEERVVVLEHAPLPRGADALTATRVLLASARRQEPVAPLLDAELARRWSRLAGARALTLEEYVRQVLAGLQAEHGPPTSFELDQGSTRAEVEVRFAGKTRDVDFQWRAGAGGWRLTGIDDL